VSRGLPTWLAGLLVAALAVLVVVMGTGYLEGDPAGTPDPDGIPECVSEDLPATALPVVEDIEAGGPFDYPRNDGGRFGNYEGILPEEALGYYREYTVQTPGLDHRGARRIVTGGDDPVDPEVWFFTDDHYESFCELDPGR
jgi:ribonuclease T1